MTMHHETIAAARAYLTAGEAERAAQRPILDEYVGDFEEVLRALRPQWPGRAETDDADLIVSLRLDSGGGDIGRQANGRGLLDGLPQCDQAPGPGKGQ